MNDARHRPTHEPMTVQQAAALRIVGDRWIRSSDVDAHADAEDALARSIARSRTLQRMLDDESARLTPQVLAASQAQLEDMVQGVRQQLEAHFEQRCRALESAMLAILDALVDDPGALAELVVSMTKDHVAASADHRIVLELPHRCEGHPATEQLIMARAWDAVEYHTGRRTPALRLDMPQQDAAGHDGKSQRWLLDPDALRLAIRESFQRGAQTAGSQRGRCG